MSEILTNENVIETTEEVIETVDSCKGIKIAAGVGGAVILGVIAYKFIVKPIVAKLKAEREDTIETEAENVDEADSKEIDSDEDETE